MTGIRHEKHGLYVAVEALVHRRHLEFVLEIRDRAQTPDDDAGLQILGEMHQQAAEGPHLDVRIELRDLGNKRQPAMLITLGSLLVFVILCWLLHRRDLILRENLARARELEKV